MCTKFNSILSDLQIVFNEQGTKEPGISVPRDMIDFETFLGKVTSHMVEKCVYTRETKTPKIYMEEIPPIIPPAMRGDVVYNTEKDWLSNFDFG